MVDLGQMASIIMAQKAKARHVDVDRSVVQVASHRRRLRISSPLGGSFATLPFDSPTSTQKGDPLSAPA